MTEEEKLKNIFAFLAILFAEDPCLGPTLIRLSPEYIIEKWKRYVESEKPEYLKGLHPILRTEFFDRYFEK